MTTLYPIRHPLQLVKPSMMRKKRVKLERILKHAKTWISVLPTINPFAFDQPVYSGDDVQLTCYIARGDEPISVSWTLNGLPLDNSRQGVNLVNVGSKTSLLTMSNVNHNSDGEYRCMAKNPAGVSSYSANLTVYGKANQNGQSQFKKKKKRKSLPQTLTSSIRETSASE
jgi:hypothetical protein